MNELKLFSHETFGNFRAIEKDGEPWFVAVDVLAYLDLDSSATRRLDSDEKDTLRLTQGNPGNPNLTIVSEGGLYSLVMGSKKSEAKAFRRWITHEVIPQIRKRGMYATPDTLTELLSKPESIVAVLTKLQQEQNARIEAEAKLTVLEPKAAFADAVSDSNGGIHVREMAHLLTQNGRKIGEIKLFRLLREDGYLSQDNKPRQPYIDNGLLRVKECIVHIKGETVPKFTTLITGKGQAFFLKKYGKKAVK